MNRPPAVHPPVATRPHRGFTLIEVLIATVIVGVLAAVAIPNYTQYIQRSRRIEATTLLQQNALYLQRFYNANNSYSQTLTGTAPVLSFLQSPAQGTALYTLRLDPGTLSATAYTLEAIPVAGQSMATDECGTLTLTNVGVRGIKGAAGGATVQKCWK